MRELEGADPEGKSPRLLTGQAQAIADQMVAVQQLWSRNCRKPSTELGWSEMIERNTPQCSPCREAHSSPRSTRSCRAPATLRITRNVATLCGHCTRHSAFISAYLLRRRSRIPARSTCGDWGSLYQGLGLVASGTSQNHSKAVPHPARGARFSTSANQHLNTFRLSQRTSSRDRLHHISSSSRR